MNPSDARTAIKTRLFVDTSQTAFDDAIDEFALAGVRRLYPISLAESSTATATVSPDTYGEAIVELTVFDPSFVALRKLESYSSGIWSKVDNFFHHGGEVHVRGLESGVTQLRGYGLIRHTQAALPEELWQPVIWFAMSEFYDLLASDKAAYNIYMQSGARSVDNMRDQSEYYEQKANLYLQDRAQLYGSV